MYFRKWKGGEKRYIVPVDVMSKWMNEFVLAFYEISLFFILPGYTKMELWQDDGFGVR